MAKVGVALVPMPSVTDEAAVPMQLPAPFVWQIPSASGRVADTGSRRAVVGVASPTLNVATANAPVPPTTFRIPVLFAVAASAITSAAGLDDAVSRSVLTPEM